MDSDGSWRPIEYKNLVKLPVLRSVIRETLRLNPPVASVVRLVMEDLVLPTTIGTDSSGESFVVPKGDLIMTSNGLSQMNPDVWEDPSRWDPLRWLNVAENVVHAGSNAPTSSSYQPFGAGRHRCSGELVGESRHSLLNPLTIRSLLY